MIEIFLRAIHLTLVGAALWLPVTCLALEVSWNHDQAAVRAQRKLIRAAVIGLVLGALTGLLYGTMLWEPAFQRALQAIGSRLPFAIVEFCFSLLLYLAYWTSLGSRIFSVRRWRLLRGLLLLVSITNLGYHFPTMLGVIHLVANLDAVQPMDSAHFRRVAFSPDVVVGSIHFLLSSVIVGSQIAIGLLRREAVSDRLLQAAAALALVATSAQWLSGIAAFLWLPRAAQIGLLSSPGYVSLSLILTTIWLFTAAQVGLIFQPRSAKWFFASSSVLGLILIQMSWIRWGLGKFI
jgi:hypothetical protein